MDLDPTGNPITGTVTGGINPVGLTNGGVDPYSVTSSMPVSATVTLAAFPAAGPISGTSGNGTAWTLQAGMALEVDTGTGREETVVVQSVTGNTFTATFYKNHPASFT